MGDKFSNLIKVWIDRERDSNIYLFEKEIFLILEMYKGKKQKHVKISVEQILRDKKILLAILF